MLPLVGAHVEARADDFQGLTQAHSFGHDDAGRHAGVRGDAAGVAGPEDRGDEVVGDACPCRVDVDLLGCEVHAVHDGAPADDGDADDGVLDVGAEVGGTQEAIEGG